MIARQILRTCKLQGLSLHSEALTRLEKELKRHATLQLDDVIYALKNTIDQTKISSSVVTVNAIESAIHSLLAIANENDIDKLQIFNAFDSPRLIVNEQLHTYELRRDRRKLHGGINDRLRLFRDRFVSVEWRVKRNRIFAPPASALAASHDYIELSHVESLRGAHGIRRVIGLLGQDERGRTYLEDYTSRIYLDLSEATYTEGVFTINCIALVEGELMDDIFSVYSMGFPPPETKAESLIILNGMDALGVEASHQQIQQMQERERNDVQATFIVLSDVHLDDPLVMKRLDILFDGLQSVLPVIIVLMGDFTSSGNTGHRGYAAQPSVQDVKECFDELAILILKYPELAQNCKFVLVPGPNDLCASRALPRHPLLPLLTEELCRRVPNVLCATNPCRIRYYTQDIVIYRQNLHHQMNQNALLPVRRSEGVMPLDLCVTNANGQNEVDEMETEAACEEHEVTSMEGISQKTETSTSLAFSRHIVKTIIDQAHLSPLPLTTSPIHWAFDSFLQLFPLPDLLILGDSTEQYQLGYASVAVFHPGLFYADYSFVLYRPSTKVTEFSCVQ